jgi:putative cell wall-binding protein
MDAEEYAERKKMESYRYNKLARHFTDAFNDDYVKLMVLHAFDYAHMEGMLSEELIEYLLDKLGGE